MTIYFFTKKRDGQPTKNVDQLYASNMQEAIAEFSDRILADIAKGNDYMLFTDQADLKEILPDYEWKGEGYYLMPDAEAMRREAFYAKGARFETYGEDVYTYGISEREDEVGGIGIN